LQDTTRAQTLQKISSENAEECVSCGRTEPAGGRARSTQQLRAGTCWVPGSSNGVVSSVSEKSPGLRGLSLSRADRTRRRNPSAPGGSLPSGRDDTQGATGFLPPGCSLPGLPGRHPGRDDTQGAPGFLLPGSPCPASRRDTPLKMTRRVRPDFSPRRSLGPDGFFKLLRSEKSPGLHGRLPTSSRSCRRRVFGHPQPPALRTERPRLLTFWTYSRWGASWRSGSEAGCRAPMAAEKRWRRVSPAGPGAAAGPGPP